MPEECDSIGAPAPQQQAVVVSAIVHTDKDNMRRVKIPAFVPLFVHFHDGRPMMSSSGVAHVKLTGGPEEFLGISLDEFCADYDKGEAYNHITVAISGAVTCAIPLSLLFNAKPFFNYVGKYIGVNALRSGALSSTPMTYENTTCVALGCAGNYEPVGVFLGTIDPAYDGIRLLLKTELEPMKKVHTDSNLGEDSTDISASKSAAAVDPPAAAVDPPPAVDLPAAAESARMFVDPRTEDADGESIGQKRPAKPSSKKERARNKKEKV